MITRGERKRVRQQSESAKRRRGMAARQSNKYHHPKPLLDDTTEHLEELDYPQETFKGLKCDRVRIILPRNKIV